MYFKLHESITANNMNTHQQNVSWYLYIIENKLGQLYTGITTAPDRRIAQHRGEKAGGARALKGKSPLTFKAVFLVGNHSDALRLEYYVKRLSKAQKLALITNKHLPGGVCKTAHFIDS